MILTMEIEGSSLFALTLDMTYPSEGKSLGIFRRIDHEGVTGAAMRVTRTSPGARRAAHAARSASDQCCPSDLGWGAVSRHPALLVLSPWWVATR